MDSEMTCWRCGVTFDNSDFIPGAPCPDCQLDDPEEYRKFSIIKASETERMEYLVGQLYSERYSDREISEALGLNGRQIRTVRDRLGLPGHKFGGTEKWKDHDAVIAKVKEASKSYWDNPNRKPRRKGHGPAVEGRLSLTEEEREESRRQYDALPTGKSQTYKGHRSVTFTDQRRNN